MVISSFLLVLKLKKKIKYPKKVAQPSNFFPKFVFLGFIGRSCLKSRINKKFMSFYYFNVFV